MDYMIIYVYITMELELPGMFKKIYIGKNMGNLPVFLDVFSLETLYHIRRFVCKRCVSLDHLSVDVLSH
jgi:hypothetical protein